MISLRKHIDEYQRAAPPVPPSDSVSRSEPSPRTIPDHPTASCERMLRAISDAVQRALPSLSSNFRTATSRVAEAAAISLEKAGETAEAEFGVWAQAASEYNERNEQEVRAIVAVLAGTSDTIVERDQRYSSQIGGLNSRLRGVATLDDVSVMRRSILETTLTLRNCIEKMVEEGREHQRKLARETAEYKKRLIEWERLSKTDALTGLPNRRAFDDALAGHLGAAKTFSVLLIDLNGFKAINDTWGHSAGDDLLKQFSAELRAHFCSPDLVARWGGDEFGAIVNGGKQDVEARADRVQEWLFGDYELNLDAGSAKVTVGGAIGTAEWDGSETAASLLTRADTILYAGKSADRRRNGDRRLAARQ